MATPLTYNSFNLNDDNYITSVIDDSAAPERELFIGSLASWKGAVIGGSTYGIKPITIAGKIVGSSASNLETLIDSLHKALAVKDKNLDIGYAGATRRYKCTYQSVKIDRPVRAAKWASFSIVFLATDYGHDTSVTTLYNASSLTAASNTKSCTVGGSAPDQYLRVSITVTAHTTAISQNYISIENDTTGQKVTIRRTWTDTDVLEIDPYNNTVKVNGTEVDYSGALPLFAPDTHDMIIADDFSTRTLSLTVDYYKRYL